MKTIYLIILFIILSYADLFLTSIIVGNNHTLETNPVARATIKTYGFWGLATLKTISVVFALFIIGAIHKIGFPHVAQKLCITISIVMGIVVVYSCCLLFF